MSAPKHMVGLQSLMCLKPAAITLFAQTRKMKEKVLFGLLLEYNLRDTVQPHSLYHFLLTPILKCMFLVPCVRTSPSFTLHPGGICKGLELGQRTAKICYSIKQYADVGDKTIKRFLFHATYSLQIRWDIALGHLQPLRLSEVPLPALKIDQVS